MKTHVYPHMLFVFLLGMTAPLSAQTYLDTFDDGSRTDGSPSTWISSSAANLSVVSDSVLNSNALQLTGSAVYFGTDLPTAFSLSTTNALSLSFKVRMTGLQEIRLGLFNNGGTKMGNSDTSSLGSTVTSAYQGIFLSLSADSYASPTQIKTQVTGEGGTNSTIFYGTDRIFGTTQTMSGTLGTSVHSVTANFLLSSASTALINVYLDGVLVDSQSLSTTALSSFIAAGGVTSIVGVDPANTGSSGNVLIDDISLSVIPEPNSFALLCLAGFGLVIGRRRCYKRK